MMYVGFLLLVVAVVAAVVGFLQRGKMKTILAAPFRPTGQALTGADGKGLVSFQGAVQAGEQLLAPCSGQPCLYFEVEIKQEWEKHVQTEDGSKKETGTDSAHEEKQGSMFYVNDGSGPVTVNANEGVDAKLETSFDEKKSYGWGDITFGNYTAHVHRPGDDKHAVATRCIEKIIPANGNLFVLGKVEGNMVTKRDGMLGKLMLAREGRDGLLGSTKRNMIAAFVAAGVFVPSGAAMAIFGEAPEAAADTCAQMKNELDEPCTGRVQDDDVVYDWEVTEEADYTFTAAGTGKDESMRLWPEIEIAKDGEVVFTLTASGPDEVEGTHHFEPGSYTITINDTSDGHAAKLKGGAGFRLEIDQVPGTATDESEAVADNEDAEVEEGETKAAKATPANAPPTQGKPTAVKQPKSEGKADTSEEKPADDKAQPENTQPDKAQPEEKTEKPAATEEKPAEKPAETKSGEGDSARGLPGRVKLPGRR